MSLSDLTQAGKLVNWTVANASGFAAFELGASLPTDTYLLSSMGVAGSVSFQEGLQDRPITVSYGVLSSASPLYAETIVYGSILTGNGLPAGGASITLNGTEVARADSNGFFSAVVSTGLHTLVISFNGYQQAYQVTGSAPTAPYALGPDIVLSGIAQEWMPVLLPLMAIAVSFDAISREATQGSPDLLLCQPIDRVGIVVGKFGGDFVACGLPFLAVNLAGVTILIALSGRSPSAGYVAVFLVSGLLLMATYILLMLVFSSLSGSVETSLVSGIATWVFLSFFFQGVLFLILSA